MESQNMDFDWWVEHGPALFEKYRGQWIAVCDREVIGVGTTASEAAERAEAHKPGAMFILEAIDSEADVIYAGR